MKQSRRIVLVFILSTALLATAALILKHHCPASGFAFTSERRELHRLKNRTAIPQASDFDNAVTIEKILQPGDDHDRWSATRAARVEGYVVSLAKGPLELTNCYLPCNRDIHIHVGLRPDAPPREQVVLEITPRMQEWASRQGLDWSEETLRGEMLGHRCSFAGWLLYDSNHAGEAENTAPGRANNWRATAWEIHPITNFEIQDQRPKSNVQRPRSKLQNSKVQTPKSKTPKSKVQSPTSKLVRKSLPRFAVRTFRSSH